MYWNNWWHFLIMSWRVPSHEHFLPLHTQRQMHVQIYIPGITIHLEKFVIHCCYFLIPAVILDCFFNVLLGSLFIITSGKYVCRLCFNPERCPVWSRASSHCCLKNGCIASSTLLTILCCSNIVLYLFRRHVMMSCEMIFQLQSNGLKTHLHELLLTSRARNYRGDVISTVPVVMVVTCPKR